MTKKKVLIGSAVTFCGIVGSIIWYLRSDHIPPDSVVAGCAAAEAVTPSGTGGWRASSGAELSGIACRATNATFRVECKYTLSAPDKTTGVRRASDHHAVLQHQRDGWHCVSRT